MIFDYYSAMDRSYGKLEPSDKVIDARTGAVESINLGPQEIGTSTNPMQHQVASFAAKIREGASKIELSFLGAGKSNSQQPSPEAFGTREREDIRAMADINKIRTSVHAPLHGQSLAGLGREGFSAEARQDVLQEIERAIHFAAQATKGGAIVFHTGEWMRPMSEIKDKAGAKFEGFHDEEKKAPKIVVDRQTGQIQAIRKDTSVFEPDFYTAAEYDREHGTHYTGKVDENGRVVAADDWIDLDGNAIRREWVLSKDPNTVERLFHRVPKFKENSKNFAVVPRDYRYYEEEAERLRARTGEPIDPEILFYKSILANQVSQAMGQSLFYAQNYKDLRKSRDAAIQARDFYKRLEESVKDKDELWKMYIQNPEIARNPYIADFHPDKNMLPSQFLDSQIEEIRDRMRHIHESSATADAQAQETIKRMNNLETVDRYGIEQTAWTIAQGGLKALDYTKRYKGNLTEDIYVAPENFRAEQFGSHPDEIRRIVNESRKTMVQELISKRGMSKEAAEELAKKHIKATVDIGHMNLWRKHFVGEKGESDEKREKRFEKWMLDETEKLAKEGILGHVHLTDNFGYDDEHLTPGQGNTPIKEFIKRMEAQGLKDFIAEAGSYNAQNVMTDTWALIGSPVYAAGPPLTFRAMQNQHMGYHNPSTYIVGAYAPSNEWHLWSEVPFE